MTGRLGSPFPAAWTTAQPDTASNNDSRAHGQCGRLHDLPSALLPDMLPFTPDSVSPSDAQLDALLLLILVRSLYKAAGETVPDCAGAFLLAFACFCFRSPLQGTLSQQQQEQDPQRTAGVLGRRLPGRLAAIRPYTLCTEPQHATWSFWGPAGSAGAPAATVRRPPKRRAPPAASAAGHELHRQACSGHAEGVPAASTQQPRAL